MGISPNDRAGCDPTLQATFDGTVCGDPPAERPAPTVEELREALASPRYAVGALIGRGGMGEVRLARDRLVDRDVAVKTLRMADPEAGASADAIGRFLREARIQGRLDHPAIVPLYDVGLDADGQPYFAMKRLVGTTLADALAAIGQGDADAVSRFSRRRLLSAFTQVCLAIEFAHTRGVVHCDLKPMNIVLGDFGEVWVIDWGVSRVDGVGAAALDDGLTSGERDAIDSAVTSVETHAGVVLGTPGYLAPEQLVDRAAIDHRADVYALGCLLFEILAGESLHPRGRDAIRSTLDGADARPSARRPDLEIPPELDRACSRAAASSRGDRFESVRELHDEVAAYLEGDRDLEIRKTHAAEHRGRAQTSLACGERGAALREAGRALALDPTDDAALGLVSRLMLEAPEHTPPEVEREIAATISDSTRAHGRAVSTTNLGFVALTPPLVLLGLQSWWWLGIMVTSVVGLAIYLRVGARLALPTPPWLVLVGNGVLIAMTAPLASPFVLPAALAAGSGMAFAMHPAIKSVWPVLGTCIAAFALPLALELVGVLEPSFTVVGGNLVLDSPVVDMPSEAVVPALFMFLGAHIVAATLFARHLHREQLDAQRQLRIQAWHLRQLVPRPDREAEGASSQPG